MDRHGTLSEGRDYMHYDPLMAGDKRKYGFGVRFGDEADQKHGSKKGGAYEGRLWRLTDQFVFGSSAGDSSIAGDIAGAIVGAIQAGLGSLRYGGPTHTPTQVVFSQRGPFGEIGISKGGIYNNAGPFWMYSPARFSALAKGHPSWYWNDNNAPRSSDDIGYITLPYASLGVRGAYTRILDKKWEEYFGDENFNEIGYALESGKLVHQKKIDSAIIRYSWRFLTLQADGTSNNIDYSGENNYFDGLDKSDAKASPIHGLDERVFPPHTSKGPDAVEPDSLIKQYSTLSYGDLGRVPYQSVMMSPSVIKTAGDAPSSDDPKWSEIKSMLDGSMAEYDKNKIIAGEYNQALDRTKLYKKWEDANSDWEKANTLEIASRIYINDKNAVELAKGGGTGNQGALGVKPVIDLDLGIIKRGSQDKYNNELVDKVNMIPYGEDYTAKDFTDKARKTSDFIKFKFKDLVNDKFIIFRAILSGITDSISPEWSGIQYIGRPDKVWVYSGAERKISFTFEIYPKTKQEFPVLLEKMNYLVGLCYPTYTAQNRMIAPFIELTLGDMFNRTPGFLDSLSVDVDDTSTWEIEEGLQFPKHITCGCSFTYVGKYLPSSLGKHYELGWLEDKGWTSKGSKMVTGTFELDNEHPSRTKYTGLFSDLGSENAK
jgi:hypothetical protein